MLSSTTRTRALVAARQHAARGFRRTNATHSKPETGTAASTASTTGTRGAHHEPAAAEAVEDEGFGKGFYIAIATAVGLAAAYKLEQSTNGEGESLITRLINKYHSRNQLWEARNALHVSLLERAAEDRNMFLGQPLRQTINIRSAETMFNTGSPWNNDIGWASGDLDAVKAHMEARRETIEAKRERK